MLVDERAIPYLKLTHYALVLIRDACRAKDCERAEDIADAVHVLPEMLYRNDERGLKTFSELYLEPLESKHPEIVEILKGYLE